MAPKILFLAGSARKDSLNKKLAKVAYELALEQGADATFIDLRDLARFLHCLKTALIGSHAPMLRKNGRYQPSPTRLPHLRLHPQARLEGCVV